MYGVPWETNKPKIRLCAAAAVAAVVAAVAGMYGNPKENLHSKPRPPVPEFMGIYGNPKENLHSKPRPPCLNLWEFMGILQKTYTPSRYPRA